MQVVFLCGARDFHALDWYKSSALLLSHPKPIILTDLIEAEGFDRLVSSKDRVSKLIILDHFLFRKQSSLGNIWRNILKALVFPLQVLLIRRFSSCNPNSLYYAHSMYYIWLASAAGLPFIGTPQGSDILIKPHKSVIYHFMSAISMKRAGFITVDSRRMAISVMSMTGKMPLIIQNGIDIASIIDTGDTTTGLAADRQLRITSFRGLAPLYRIDHLFCARNDSRSYSHIGIDLIYPVYEQSYASKVEALMKSCDQVLGRISRESLYSHFRRSFLSISIPSSDSSPRSVYEAIFCGSLVALSNHDFIHELPPSMRQRVLVVNFDDPLWFDQTVEMALSLLSSQFIPCVDALNTFDQTLSFSRLHHLATEVFHSLDS